MGYKTPVKLSFVGGHNVFDYADSTTYYFGNSTGSNPSTVTNFAFPIPINGIIRVCSLRIVPGTVGSNEATAYSVRNVTTSTDALIGNVDLSAVSTTLTNANLSLPCSVGDLIIIKIVAPAWATNPLQTRVYYSMVMDIE